MTAETNDGGQEVVLDFETDEGILEGMDLFDARRKEADDLESELRPSVDELARQVVARELNDLGLDFGINHVQCTSGSLKQNLGRGIKIEVNVSLKEGNSRNGYGWSDTEHKLRDRIIMPGASLGTDNLEDLGVERAIPERSSSQTITMTKKGLLYLMNRQKVMAAVGSAGEIDEVREGVTVPGVDDMSGAGLEENIGGSLGSPRMAEDERD